MLFNSLPFLAFLPTVLVLYYLLPHKLRWILLLLSSYIFYGFWKVEYLSLIILSTIVDYTCARWMGLTESRSKKKIALVISLTSNIGLLALFKYAGWFISDVATPLGLIGSDSAGAFQTFWSFALPVGISFYTFQTMGYSIDVYQGKVKPEKNPFKFALFVSFFPQLVAGPIERFSSLNPQLFKQVSLKYDHLKSGARLMLYGLFIKMCVADNLSPLVDQIFQNASEASSIQLFTGMILFGLQIYSDFHGYSLIAIGVARMLGINLMKNFDAPYTALSIREFWSRWHISLSTWFRDYLFIPLGGSRVNTLRLTLNILVVFLVSGLWHGANWTFVVWGGLHGLAYLAERWFLSNDTRQTLRFPRWFATMSIVYLAWIFFRSDSIGSAFQYVSNMFASSAAGIQITWDPILISIVGLFLLSDLVFRGSTFHDWVDPKPFHVRWTVYGFLIFGILALSGTINHPFIYFQF